MRVISCIFFFLKKKAKKRTRTFGVLVHILTTYKYLNSNSIYGRRRVLGIFVQIKSYHDIEGVRSLANYKRVISYMYQYRNQLKGNNVGFARIETRDTQCKITINVRVPNMKEQDIRSYIYCWYNKEMHGVFLGNVHINNGVGELVVKTDIDNMMNSKYRFTDMGGIILYVNDSQYFGTEWDGNPAICNGLFIDTEKPNDFVDHIGNQAVKAATVAKEEVKAVETVSPQTNHEAEASGMDELIEDEVAKEELSAKAMTAAVTEQALEETVKSEEIDRNIEAEAEQDSSMSEQEIEEDDTVNQQEVKETEEEEGQLTGSFPLSQEKINHLDQQAQELFGTMLFNAIYPDEKQEDKEEQQEVTENQAVERNIGQEQQENVLEAEQTLAINPKSAIECFTAFRSCESAQEYDEIQEEIHTMEAQIVHLKRISEEWKIKEARINEMRAEKEESEKRQKEIEDSIRASYHIDGIEGEVEAAELKGTVVDRIFNKYPKIQPFKEGVVEQCIRIEPQDLGIFPMENWILANNSFLLHGYYSYRHLIFAMETEAGRKKFILGVPGVNHSRERFMANMFGFNEFKMLAQQDEGNGDFGYWCQEIKMHS